MNNKPRVKRTRRKIIPIEESDQPPTQQIIEQITSKQITSKQSLKINDIIVLDDLSSVSFDSDFCQTDSGNSQVEFILPFKAFTVNSFYKKWRNVITIPKEGREWKNNISNFIIQNHLPKLTGKISLTLGFWFKTKQKRDLDNLFKPLIDTFKNVLFEDDDMIYSINAFKKIGAGKDIMYVKINQFEN
jgi:Holliday junction resolvase RusA-like endonuclease